MEKMLYVNCAIGVSRIGAIATAARELVGLDQDQFVAENPCIAPNPSILNILRLEMEKRKL
jgi:hypothetical protein